MPGKKEAVNQHERKKFRVGILGKLLMGILIPLVAILLIVEFSLNAKVGDIVYTLNSQNANNAAENGALVVENFFQRYTSMVETIADSSDLKNSLHGWANEADLTPEKQATVASVLNGYIDGSTQLFNLWMYNMATGQLMEYDGGVYGRDVFDGTTRSWYQQVMEKREVTVSGAYEDVTTKNLVVTVSAPIIEGGTITGIIGIDLALTDMEDTLSQLKVGETGYIVIYDNENYCIFHPNEELKLKHVEELGYSDEVVGIIENHQAVSNKPVVRSGDELYITTTYLEDVGYFIMGTIPKAEFDSHVQQVSTTMLLYFAGCIILLAAIATVLGYRITKGMKELTVAASKIANGDLSVEIRTQSNDEVGVLANDIRAIVDRLQEYILYIEEVTRALNRIGDGDFTFQLQQSYVGEFAKVKEALLQVRATFSDTLRAVVEAAEQVNHGAHQLATGAQSLAQGSTEQASSIEEIAVSISEMTHHIHENTVDTQESNQEIQTVVQELTEGNEKMNKMANAMEEIFQNATEMGKIIKSIEDIAFQTNILALNAAVEAARAGTAGKGFAVVADEVRSLAARSAKASKDTSELIAASLRAVNYGKSVADDTVSTIRQTFTSIDNVAKRSEKVANSSASQDKVIQQTSAGIDLIANVVQSNTATAEESAAASEELSGQAALLKNLVARFQLEDTPTARQGARTTVTQPSQDTASVGEKY